MTYNIKGLPWPVALGRDEALGRIADRLAMLRRAGRQPHIVLLQEAFTDQAAQIAAQAGYTYVATGPDAMQMSGKKAGAADIAYLADARWDRGEGVGKQLGSGLLILSDYPIVATHRMAFPDFACAGFDCLANKGALIAHLAVPGVEKPVSVINVHLNSRKAAGVAIGRSNTAFARQVTLVTQFVADHVPADRPAIFGGDMNIGRDNRRVDMFFAGFARAGFAFVRPDLGGARRALAQAASDTGDDLRDLTHSSQRAKDWLFARSVGNQPMPVIAAHVPFGVETDGAPLSDHYGYVVDYLARPPVRLATGNAAGEAL